MTLPICNPWNLTFPPSSITRPARGETTVMGLVSAKASL
ncbi:Uncharacterised protein [Mycobacteroides abscessus subsp. abscessus]|nr:Uncharacterised protein [Mycobacteroides abscessus]SHU06025.1 Uncharacterised protein [Mycobacteroides abscessus subsp. abscessus]